MFNQEDPGRNMSDVKTAQEHFRVSVQWDVWTQLIAAGGRKRDAAIWWIQIHLADLNPHTPFFNDF